MNEYKPITYDRFKHDKYLLLEFLDYDEDGKHDEYFLQFLNKYYNAYRVVHLDIHPIFKCVIMYLEDRTYVIKVVINQYINYELYSKLSDFRLTKEYEKLISDEFNFNFSVNISNHSKQQIRIEFWSHILINDKNFTTDMDYIERVGLDFLHYIENEFWPVIEKIELKYKK